jgi:hypothetical protein
MWSLAEYLALRCWLIRAEFPVPTRNSQKHNPVRMASRDKQNSLEAVQAVNIARMSRVLNRVRRVRSGCAWRKLAVKIFNLLPSAATRSLPIAQVAGVTHWNVHDLHKTNR